MSWTRATSFFLASILAIVSQAFAQLFSFGQGRAKRNSIYERKKRQHAT